MSAKLRWIAEAGAFFVVAGIAKVFRSRPFDRSVDRWMGRLIEQEERLGIRSAK